MGRTWRPGTSLCALATFALFAGAFPAHAAWTDPIDLLEAVPAEPAAEEPRLAVDVSGTATVAWRRGSFVETTRIAADGTVESERVIGLADSVAAGPTVDVNDSGEAAVAWRQSAPGIGQTRIVVARLRPGEPHSATNVATGFLRGRPEVAVGDDGVATVVWLGDCTIVGGDCRVNARRISPTGVQLGSELTVSGIRAAAPDVDVDPDGRATVAWARGGTSAFLDTVEARRIGAGGELASVQTLLANQEAATDPRVAVDRFGQATAAFRAEGQGDDFVHICRITVGGAPDCSLGLPQLGADPDVTVDGSGRATVLWRRGTPPTATIEALRIPAIGGFTSEDVITVSEQPAEAVDGASLAANGAGEVIFTWLGPAEGQPAEPIAGVSRRLAADEETLGGLAPIPEVSGSAIDVGLAADGQATAVWAQEVGGAIVPRASQDIAAGALTFRALKRNRARGTAKLTVGSSVGGTIRLAPTRQLRGAQRALASAGDVVLPVRARGVARRKLLRAGRVAVRAQVTLVPRAGSAVTKTKRMRLVRRR